MAWERPAGGFSGAFLKTGCFGHVRRHFALPESRDGPGALSFLVPPALQVPCFPTRLILGRGATNFLGNPVFCHHTLKHVGGFTEVSGPGE